MTYLMNVKCKCFHYYCIGQSMAWNIQLTQVDYSFKILGIALHGIAKEIVAGIMFYFLPFLYLILMLYYRKDLVLCICTSNAVMSTYLSCLIGFYVKEKVIKTLLSSIPASCFSFFSFQNVCMQSICSTGDDNFLNKEVCINILDRSNSTENKSKLIDFNKFKINYDKQETNFINGYSIYFGEIVDL